MELASRIGVDVEKIRDFMEANDLSEPALAKAMDVSYSYVWRVLREKRDPGEKFLAGCVRAGMDPDDVFIYPEVLPKGNKL